MVCFVCLFVFSRNLIFELSKLNETSMPTNISRLNLFFGKAMLLATNHLIFKGFKCVAHLPSCQSFKYCQHAGDCNCSTQVNEHFNSCLKWSGKAAQQNNGDNYSYQRNGTTNNGNDFQGFLVASFFL